MPDLLLLPTLAMNGRKVGDTFWMSDKPSGQRHLNPEQLWRVIEVNARQTIVEKVEEQPSMNPAQVKAERNAMVALSLGATKEDIRELEGIVGGMTHAEASEALIALSSRVNDFFLGLERLSEEISVPKNRDWIVQRIGTMSAFLIDKYQERPGG